MSVKLCPCACGAVPEVKTVGGAMLTSYRVVCPTKDCWVGRQAMSVEAAVHSWQSMVESNGIIIEIDHVLNVPALDRFRPTVAKVTEAVAASGRAASVAATATYALEASQNERAILEAEIVEWKTNSGLEVLGDPGGVTPDAALTFWSNAADAHDAREAELEKLRLELDLLRELNATDNEVCLCGCPPSDHENYGEDGEACGHADHECMRTCIYIAGLVSKLRRTLIGRTAEAEMKAAEILRLRVKRELYTADVREELEGRLRAQREYSAGLVIQIERLRSLRKVEGDAIESARGAIMGDEAQELTPNPPSCTNT